VRPARAPTAAFILILLLLAFTLAMHLRAEMNDLSHGAHWQTPVVAPETPTLPAPGGWWEQLPTPLPLPAYTP
jgi:hypothetical protein